MDNEYEKLMDRYRDVYNWSVYRCPTCGFRGVGMAASVHPLSHGTMIKETKYEAQERKSTHSTKM